jgi:hypothetical protein
VFLHALIFKGLEDFRKGGKMTGFDRFFPKQKESAERGAAWQKNLT